MHVKVKADDPLAFTFVSWDETHSQLFPSWHTLHPLSFTIYSFPFYVFIHFLFIFSFLHISLCSISILFFSYIFISFFYFFFLLIKLIYIAHYPYMLKYNIHIHVSTPIFVVAPSFLSSLQKYYCLSAKFWCLILFITYVTYVIYVTYIIDHEFKFIFDFFVENNRERMKKMFNFSKFMDYFFIFSITFFSVIKLFYFSLNIYEG